MNILALDTTKKTALITTYVNNKSASIFTGEHDSHSENLLSKIDEVLFNERISLADINTFSVVVGPGSFTGIRISVSLVKAFLFGTQKKCVAVNSFEMLAYNINSASIQNDFLVCLNADNRGCYTAHFNKDKTIKNMKVLSLADLEKYLNANNLQLFVKDDEKEYFDAVNCAKNYVNISEDTLINLTLEKEAKNEFIGINELEPLYIKLSQAEDQYREKMLKNLKIEKAYISDLLELEKLEKEIFGDEAYGKDSLKDEIKKDDRLFLVAKLNDEIIGYADSLKTQDNMINILKIAVKPLYRKLLIATKLLEHLNIFAKSNNFKKMFLEVNEHNAPAINFYKKLGFIETNKRKKYYKDGADAIIMFLQV
ncbi:MAG: tRNA (adenosine(37)-N6)-threonylcarbamoyltransferase complex dimerization subunit type 1 TsaB [Clostridia bacterium]|nr:tRNA (adenosine(37)-N6)-threonylcarbamoyltransferase complex dimerization subunit type 1 TsaB [Clostridia bacterium]